MLFYMMMMLNWSLLSVPTQKDIETDYDQLYLYHSEKKDVEQRLYVKFLSEKECEFKLVIVREKCDDSFSGKAILKAGDSEIDEDASGEAYPVDEYYSDNPNLELFLRIANDREKAKIVFAYKKNTQNSCTFVSEQLMYSE
jgi:hypothetical protein